MKSGNEHIIWQDEILRLEDWKDALREEYPELTAEHELYDKMVEMNTVYLDDERSNLGDIVIRNGIIVVAELNLWSGVLYAYRIIKSGKVSDCLHKNEFGDAAWYVDARGEFRARLHHHDGVNLCRYRAIRDDVSQEKLEELEARIVSGKEFEPMLRRLTYRLGDIIGDVYGWSFPNRPKSAVSGRCAL